MDKPPLCYEDAAMHVTLTGWACVRCKRFFGNYPDAEASARYCCHTEAPCKECGGRNLRSRSYTCCDACGEKHRTERWLALPRVEWDGEAPLCLWDDDRFFWNADDLQSYVDGDDLEIDDPPRKLEDVRLVLAKPVKPREFEMADYLSDELPEDDDTDFNDIDQIVNDYIAGLPRLYHGSGKAVSLESLRLHLREEEG